MDQEEIEENNVEDPIQQRCETEDVMIDREEIVISEKEIEEKNG